MKQDGELEKVEIPGSSPLNQTAVQFEFNQPTITFPPIADDVNMGLKTLREFTLTFDKKTDV